ncbi:hypothetical protein [Tatumella terrea]|uniref:Uncharacterized protein n=1 Tax=Tatumella terrea TaxID=419007 RepID=A0ABW1VVI3_9GAMM
MKNDFFSSCQNVAGNSHRVAGRDYIEHQAPANIHFILMTESKEKLDIRAIENERFFCRRFRFSANSVARKKLIGFQDTYQFTDHQISWLSIAGLIHIKEDDVYIKSSRPVRCAGYFMVSLLTLIFSICLWVFLFSPRLTTNAGAIILLLAVIYVAVMWLTDKACLQPSRWLRSRNILSKLIF